MKISRRVRVGVIGCGKQAEQTHIPNLMSIPEAELVALADLDELRLARLGSLYNVDQLYPDYLKLLNSELDAVLVCTPTSSHAAIALQAASSGKHVFVEKPLATIVSDAERVVQRAKDNGLKLMVGFQMRFLPNHVKVRQMIQSGQIGKVLVAEMHSETLQIKLEDGILLDYGTHFFDLMRWYMDGDPVAMVNATVTKTATAQCAIVRMEFASHTIGILGLYWIPAYESWERVERYCRFLGDKGKILTDQSSPVIKLFRPKTILSRMRGYQQIMLPFAIHPNLPISATTYRKELEEFVNAIREDREPSISGHDGVMAVKIADAAKLSSQTGSAVEIS